jgi:hypothetical protein
MFDQGVADRMGGGIWWPWNKIAATSLTVAELAPDPGSTPHPDRAAPITQADTPTTERQVPAPEHTDAVHLVRAMRHL